MLHHLLAAAVLFSHWRVSLSAQLLLPLALRREELNVPTVFTQNFLYPLAVPNAVPSLPSVTARSDSTTVPEAS